MQKHCALENMSKTFATHSRFQEWLQNLSGVNSGVKRSLKQTENKFREEKFLREIKIRETKQK